jgi:quinoprotein glucose dehydrogenase
MVRRIAALAGVAAAVLAGGAATARPAPGDWPTYGRDPGGMRFSPLSQINTGNVARLNQAWVYHMKPAGPAASPAQARRNPGQGNPTPGIRGGRFVQSEVTPLVVGGMMYISTPYRRVVALDPATGAELWVHEDQAPSRGLEYWPGDKAHGPRLLYTNARGLVELDAKTGQPIADFGRSGVLGGTRPGRGASSPPVVYANLVITGAANPNGDGRDQDIRAFDIVTGKQIWRFATIPEKGQFGYDTWAAGSAERQTGVHVWGGMTVDARRGIVYAPLNDPDWNRYGGDRHGDNLFSASVVALDARTGKRLWHFQVVHHDIWDLDASPPPTLFDVKRGGRTIPAVAVSAKAGLVFLLDRTNGKPIYGVEERPVPQSAVPMEETSPTQPFPVKPAPFVRTTMSMADIADVTPELEAFCRKLVVDNDIGMGGPYLPPGWNRPTVNFPGTNAAINYGGFAFDPALGYLIVNSQDLGQITGIGPKGGPRTSIGLAGAGPGANPNIPYDMTGQLGRFKDPSTNMMCQKPPWGSLTAVNVNTGEIAWSVPLGVTDRLPPEKQNTGRPNLGGSIVTAGGLVFVGATDDARFRAFDARTGEALWTVKLAAPNHSVPVTYLAGGKQYLAFPATGGSFLDDPAADDALVAYALP